MQPPPLPAEPAGPLHIFPPWLVLAIVLAVALAVLLAAFALLLRRILRDRPTPVGTPAAVRSGRGSFRDRVDAIRRRAEEAHAWRDGCHALAAESRRRLEQTGGTPAGELTASEIADRLTDPRVGHFMVALRDRRFGRDEPDRDDLVKLCRRAKRVLGGEAPRDGEDGS